MAKQCATATAHPNVALIKYWGKRAGGDNLPAVGSLSITLGAMQTRTQVCFDSSLEADQLLLDGQAVPGEQARLVACLDALRRLAGQPQFARVESRNDFPTGAGLASSASGYAALVVAGGAALGLEPDDPRLASVARIGSGSAPRSLFGGFAVLRNVADGTRCEQLLEASSWPLDIVVAVTSEAGKSVTSRDGMQQSARTSPFYPAWIESHAQDMAAAEQAVLSQDFEKLAELSEHSCLKMHAVMMCTRPPLMYWSAATFACILEIQAMRREGLPVFFTIDAGPQVKAVCLPDATAAVSSRLADLPGVRRLIPGGLGGGPTIIANDA